MNVGFPIVVVLVVLAAVLVARQSDQQRRGRILRRAAFALMAIFSLLFGAFVVGETFADPGGWRATGLVLLWAGPALAAGLVAWLRPGWVVVPLAVAVSAVVGMSVWFAAAPHAWSSFEDRNGPVRTIAVFAVAAVVALLGLRRAMTAGVMLLVLGTVPIVISTIASGEGIAALAIASSPTLVAGVLYVMAAMIGGSTAAAPGGVAPSNLQPGSV
jgi:hypothetical protein